LFRSSRCMAAPQERRAGAARTAARGRAERLGHGRGDDLEAGVGRVVGALALARVVVAHVVRVLLVELVAGAARREARAPEAHRLLQRQAQALHARGAPMQACTGAHVSTGSSLNMPARAAKLALHECAWTYWVFVKRVCCECSREWVTGGSSLQRARHASLLAGARPLALPTRDARPHAGHSDVVCATPEACARMGRGLCRAARLQEEAQLQAPVVLEVVICRHSLVHHLRAAHAHVGFQPVRHGRSVAPQSACGGARRPGAACAGSSTACGNRAAAAGLQTGARGEAASQMQRGTLSIIRQACAASTAGAGPRRAFMHRGNDWRASAGSCAACTTPRGAAFSSP